MRARVLIALPAFALAACIGGGDDTGPGGVPVDLSDCQASDGDPVDFVEARVSGDSLEVDVAFGGGCEAHDFAICWPDQAFLESEPVQVNLEIWHDANGDGCEAYLRETIMADLSGLKQSWMDAYQQSSGTILINIGGEQVEYSF
ncbi:MAG: hypothetical protein H6740_29060 [Alphaproteobacteria bacterium]|nr:hypothetical protein [Alphaproteobacteria bacterium]